MTGGVDGVELDALDDDPVPVRDAHRDHVDAALLTYHRDAPGTVAQGAEAGHVIGMDVGVGGPDEFQVELVKELNVAVYLLEHRVDDQRLAPRPAGDEIGVGAGHAFEQLPEDHQSPLSRQL